MNRQEWSLKHAACPKCGNTDLRTTLVGVIELGGNYEDNINTADCKCGWAGMDKDLVPATGATQAMPIRTLDCDGDTYVATKDVVATILDFGNKVKPSLHTPDQIAYTDALLGEVVKALVTVDKQHWVNKYNYELAVKAQKEKEAKDTLDNQSAPKSE